MNQPRWCLPEPECLEGNRPGETEIVSHRLPNGIVIEVRGDVDLATAPSLERELLRAEESHDVMALDLSQTSFMDSTGIHVIITASRRVRKRGGRLVVVQGPRQIRRLFTITRAVDHLELIDDAAELKHSTAVNQ